MPITTTKDTIERLTLEGKNMKEIAGILDIPYSKTTTLLKKYFPDCRGSFTRLRGQLGLDPWGLFNKTGTTKWGRRWAEYHETMAQVRVS